MCRIDPEAGFLFDASSECFDLLRFHFEDRTTFMTNKMAVRVFGITQREAHWLSSSGEHIDHPCPLKRFYGPVDRSEVQSREAFSRPIIYLLSGNMIFHMCDRLQDDRPLGSNPVSALPELFSKSCAA
jgi:hypothetical protein